MMMTARRRSDPPLPWHWGAAPARAVHPERDRPISRTILTRADPRRLMVWISQLRRAPYSYDWIDNLGRRSPRAPDGQGLRSGDQLMYIFTVTGVSPTHVEAAMTNRLARAVFGPVTIRYDVLDHGAVRSIQYTMWLPTASMPGRLRRYLLAWGDLIMARKQLFTLVALAESTIETPPTKE